MPWRGSVVLSLLVKMITINYIHVWRISAIAMLTQILYSDDFAVVKLSFLLRCVPAGFGFPSVLFVPEPLLDQLKAVVLQD